tara:strand:+ start:291 stop:755 length:465 start_codon:yes stop_codon:yes gene_type:complete
MNFITEAKQVESICSNINLVNFDDNPQEMVRDNPWLREHGLPALVLGGEVISGKSLFDWLNAKKSQSDASKGNSSSEVNSSSGGPSETHIGESSFGSFSLINSSLGGEISTGNYSSIGAKQGSEGINHEDFSDGGSATLSLDALEAQRKKQLSS